jgi:prepilin-type processing-associated H-X9-DG protein
MQFTLSTLFAAAVLVAMSLAVFGPWGLLVGAFLLSVVAWVRGAESRWRTLTRFVVVLLFGFCLIVLLLPAVASEREPARRSQCKNNLRQIGLGLFNYQAAHGRLPPVRQCDRQGQPQLSWRVVVLPFVEQDALFQQFNCSEPWDGPNNRKLANIQIQRPIYECRSDLRDKPEGTTNYVAVVGPDGDWLDPDNRAEDASNPVRVVETCNVRIVWAEPRDVSLDEILAPSPSRPCALSSKHFDKGSFFYRDQPAGANALFADGRVCLISPEVPDDVLRAALLGDRQKQEELATYAARKVNWPNSAALGSLIACVVLMLVWPRRRAATMDAEENSRGRLRV